MRSGPAIDSRRRWPGPYRAPGVPEGTGTNTDDSMKLTIRQVAGTENAERARRASRARGLGRDERGSALVEFTLLLPVLLLILFGVLDFGRAINYWIDESQLAGVGARYAAVDRNPGPGGTLQESVQGQADTQELRDGGTSSVPSPAQVCIDFPNGTSNVGDPVEANVSVDYNWLPFLGDQVGFATTTMTSSATMRLEQAPSNYDEGCS
jgi:Flp pilus assembly protein TadG